MHRNHHIKRKVEAAELGSGLKERVQKRQRKDDVIVAPQPIRPRDFSQGSVLSKLEEYLKRKDPALSFATLLPPLGSYPSQDPHSRARKNPNDGHCNGFVITWLKNISKGMVELEWFYDIKEFIVLFPLEFWEPHGKIVDVEKFLAHIQWGQNAKEYELGVRYYHLLELLEIHDGQYFYEENYFNDDEFSSWISANIQEKDMVTVVSRDTGDKCHVIGIYRENNHYYCFDPNNASGRHIETDEPGVVTTYVKFGLYSNLGIVVQERMELFINVARHQPELKLPLPKQEMEWKFVSVSDFDLSLPSPMQVVEKEAYLNHQFFSKGMKTDSEVEEHLPLDRHQYDAPTL